ncbi:guanylate cyclase [Sedimentitalea sp. CY04]|uniref:Guanylate cyclase n=1 Tax=Parasedimentitalea denitrificans TaxID=2211118 RepID=A0ABX0WDW8_9RHOB|nr:heme NO-binding domain-containing protein [Sedimentitalea sp. CY04]NIZ63512.1 guanylate cyclase [Sedimentitalea sp. CY04]
MKGMVFVELFRMAETVMSEDELDDIIDKADLQSDGAYTSVGNYPCGELIQLVVAIGERLDVPIAALQTQFGHWMFDRFVKGYPEFFEGKKDAFEMLEAIDGEVHVEVRKLYPDAELPVFQTERYAEGEGLKMTYASDRPLNHFCLGLIEGCIEHFKSPADIKMHDITSDNRCQAEFLIERTN